jgi:hypothetical protein
VVLRCVLLRCVRLYCAWSNRHSILVGVVVSGFVLGMTAVLMKDDAGRLHPASLTCTNADPIGNTAGTDENLTVTFEATAGSTSPSNAGGRCQTLIGTGRSHRACGALDPLFGIDCHGGNTDILGLDWIAAIDGQSIGIAVTQGGEESGLTWGGLARAAVQLGGGPCHVALLYVALGSFAVVLQSHAHHAPDCALESSA